MPFERRVEAGRVALVNYGPEYGKLLVIADILDQNRVLVDGPGEERRVHSLKRLAVTDIKIDVERGAKKSAIVKAWQAADVPKMFAATGWGKKMAARKAKAATTDFERHVAMIKKIKRGRIAKKALKA
ncbi:unnamed protein product [Pedinophyceae sp. YPF-701]|nr:unnamed protein product [Pedinophyceae sp. YPF-701]